MVKKEFHNKIKKISKLMSLESKVNIIGSAAVSKSVYYSDYDSFETVKGKNVNTIYNHFKSLFEIINDSENTVVSDFKIGSLKGEPLRWTYENIKNRNNNGVSFEDALRQKGMIKLDIITLLNGRFIEISEVYNIYLDGSSNYDASKESIMSDIQKEMNDHFREGNYMKVLKRFYSLKKLEDENKYKYMLNNLVDYFNSPVGLLYRCKSDLETLLIVIDSYKFDLEEIRNSLQYLKEIISAFPVENNLNNISLLKTKEEMKLPIHKQILILKRYINKDAEKIIRYYF
jgi:hypothetical protein